MQWLNHGQADLVFAAIDAVRYFTADVQCCGHHCCGAVCGKRIACCGWLDDSSYRCFTNLFIGVSLGANVLAARFYASGKHKEMSETVHTAITLALVSGIIMAFAD